MTCTNGLCPATELQAIAASIGASVSDLAFARHLDAQDPLREQRAKFAYPKNKTLPGVDLTLCQPEDDCVYFCGNSLGLMPNKTTEYVNRELTKWTEMGVHGHLEGQLPWAKCEDYAVKSSAKLVGAQPEEVAIMSGLTVDLHLLFCSFYRPTRERFRILLEDKAFPSDHYLVDSQVRLHGYDPETAVIYVKPRDGNACLEMEDILACIAQYGDEIAVVFLPGVQYYTGQLYDMKKIVAAGHAKNCIVGFDLAHAIGNVRLNLHDWDVDFAAWCTYKYLNSGAGGIGGLFFHKRWHDDELLESGDQPLVRLEGWWGHRFETRFKMTNKRDLIPGAGGFKLSNAPPLLVAPLMASLEIYDSISFDDFLRKQFLLTGYLEMLLLDLNQTLSSRANESTATVIGIFTPSDPRQRGSQLSLTFSAPLETVRSRLDSRGFVCDVREPHVLRAAPSPLYNSFVEVLRFIQALKESLELDHTKAA
ncbi:Kynureninase [Hypsibius exemplaris]|uniref:Kynureninase n=1 Tax=Hypsibius exemplaris TaxID=2072580 RepID=A0A1W0XCD0_HYPEX|nr:Kynureninase [Hypsibius exemplaris]